MEDPELILEQNIRDMNDQVPKMNESIAMVAAEVKLLEKENAKYKTEFNELSSKIKASIQAGRDDIAGHYATQIQQIKSALARNEAQLGVAQQALEKAKQVKEVFLREKERKTREAMQAIRDARRAKWQAKVADALESFSVAGVDATHDEMVRKIEEQTALNESKMEMALGNVDVTSMKIEQDAEKIRAQELVKQFKVEMGMAEAAGASPAKEGEAAEKTIGKRAEVKQ
jgi:phage shock protein A